MQSINGRVFNVDPKYISNPESSEFITIWRNNIDNKYYGRRSDGVDEPLGGVAPSGVDCFSKEIAGPFVTNDEPSSFDECFMVLEPGTYIFDADFNARVTGIVPFVGNSIIQIVTNTDESINLSPCDITRKQRIIEPSQTSSVDTVLSCHLMTGKITINENFSFKVYLFDASDGDISVENISMRAIKIS